MKNNIIINDNNVQKTHHSVIACDKEKQLLGLLQGHNICPEILDCNGKSIVITFINGNTLAEIINSNNKLTDVFEEVVDFITQFNRLTNNIVLDDINLKNFILSENRIYGIDFEKWHYGNNSDNYAAVMAMIKMANYEAGQDRDTLCRHIENYITQKAGYEKTAFRKSVDMFIEKTALRRKTMKKIRQCDCVIIAGGKSSRMGSPKGLLDYNGYTFIDHIIYNTAIFDAQYISANDNAYSRFGCELIEDIVKDTGPLGAIYSALDRCEKEYVFFVPCDMPFISEESIFQFFDEMDTGADAVIFSADGRLFPTVGIYRKTALEQVERQIESGNYKLMELLNSINTQYVEAKCPQQFRNINTPQDYNDIK